MGWFQSQSGWTNIIIDKCILHINKSFSNPYQISEHHLGGGLLVFISNGLHLGIIDIVWRLFSRIGSSQRTIGGNHNIILFAQGNQFFLVQRGMTLDLENSPLVTENLEESHKWRT